MSADVRNPIKRREKGKSVSENSSIFEPGLSQSTSTSQKFMPTQYSPLPGTKIPPPIAPRTPPLFTQARSPPPMIRPVTSPIPTNIRMVNNTPVPPRSPIIPIPILNKNLPISNKPDIPYPQIVTTPIPTPTTTTPIPIPTPIQDTPLPVEESIEQVTNETITETIEPSTTPDDTLPTTSVSEIRNEDGHDLQEVYDEFKQSFKGYATFK